MSTSSPEVRVEKADLFGEYLYRVYVDEVKYDQFFSAMSLTWAQQAEVARGYREALTHYEGF